MNIHDDSIPGNKQPEEAEKAFTDVYNEFSGPIFANVLKMVKNAETAEEIVQDVFTTLWQKWHVIRIDKSLSAYLYRMSANKVVDFFRSMKTNRAMMEHFTALATEHYSHIEEALLYRENEQLLQRALEVLTPQQRRVYQLCKTEGRSYKEAAELLGISAHTIKEYMVKANQQVRNYVISNIDKSLSLLFLLLMKK